MMVKSEKKTPKSPNQMPWSEGINRYPDKVNLYTAKLRILT